MNLNQSRLPPMVKLSTADGGKVFSSEPKKTTPVLEPRSGGSGGKWRKEQKE